jgi:cell wall-associated NlpC family hydrolase
MGLSPFDTPDLAGRNPLAGFANQLTKFSQRAAPQALTQKRTGLSALTGINANQGLGSFTNRFTQASGTGGFSNAFTQAGQETAAYGQPGQAMGGAVGDTGNATIDRFNPEISQAAQQFGVPANLLKAMVLQESSGNWERDNRVTTAYRGQRMLPFVGIFESTAKSWGLNFDAMIGNRSAQIAGMAKILNGLAQQYGGYENAAKVYFGGPQALQGGFTDELGMNSNQYGSQVISRWKQWDGDSGYTGGYGDGALGTGIVQKALEYVGVPYVWGSLPQAGDDPWKTGWDCSAFIDYLDNTVGSNELPAGSHFQYADTVKKGLLIQDPSQLQAGDLVFFDTGNTRGGGANLNSAGHVGMYIGNGQFIQAANPSAGTIVSNLSDYMQTYGFLGGRKMGWSGGGGQQTNRPSFTNLVQQYLLAA